MNPVCSHLSHSHTIISSPFAQQQYLEKVDIATGVAQAKHMLLLRMLWDRLHDAVLCKEGTPWGAILIRGIFPVSLIKQQSTAWERQKQSDTPAARPENVEKA